MRTIEIKLFAFDELNADAQQEAIRNYRISDNFNHDQVWSEAEETVEVFNTVFNLNSGHRSWLEYSENFEDSILDLKGLRLRTWLINNHFYDVFKGRYYGKLVNTFKDGKAIPVSSEHPAGVRHVKRYSKAMFEYGCSLTGVCYDMDILDPIVKFLEYKPENRDQYDETSITNLLDECFDSLRKSIDSEIEGRMEDDYIIQEIEANELEFLEDGTQH